MTRHYDRDGEPVEPRDVLDGEELADYYRSRRERTGPFKTPHRGPLRIDEDGYDQFGGYHFEREMENR